jgi:uncharacterized membrane protein
MRIDHSFAILVAVLLLSACPRHTQSPAPASEAATAKEVPGMSDSTPPQGQPLPQAPKGKRAPGQEHEPVLAFRGFGTEPFWGARVDGDTLVFTTPENQQGTVMHGRRVPSLVGFVFIGKDGDRDFHLGLTPGECSDGMSDNRYEYVATFIYGATTYKGCGEAAK